MYAHSKQHPGGDIGSAEKMRLGLVAGDCPSLGKTRGKRKEATAGALQVENTQACYGKAEIRSSKLTPTPSNA